MRIDKQNPSPTLQWLLDHMGHKGKDCLEWPYSNCREGYGRTKLADMKIQSSHRVMCRLVYGEPPKGKRVAAHSCGNRNCVNPTHLRWATHQENSDDMLIHGTRHKGTQVTSAKLSENNVHDIRRRLQRGEHPKDIAKLYDVNKYTITSIRKGRSWAWLETPGIKKKPAA